MLKTAQELIQRVGKRLGLAQSEIEYLLKTDAEHEFEIELSTGTHHKAYRVQHNNTLGPYKGGIRFHPEVNLEEVRALATLMSLKTAAVGLPLGGGKGGISVDARSLSERELEEIARKYARHLTPHIKNDKDVPGPDVGVSPQIIDWMVDEFQSQTGEANRASFTGKSVGKGGSLGRDAATGRGGVIVMREVLKQLGKQDELITIGIQGFGNVGSFFGEIAEIEQPNWRLTAATDSSGGLASNKGLSAKELDNFKKSKGRLIDYAMPEARQITNETLLTEDVDVLIMAALGDVITEQNMTEVRAKYILELANGPVNDVAHDYLSEKGVVIIPDILANAGGVIVSYLEWQQNKTGEHWPLETVNKQLESYLINAADEVWAYADRQKLSLKEAAISLAVKRILGAKRSQNGANETTNKS